MRFSYYQQRLFALLLTWMFMNILLEVKSNSLVNLPKDDNDIRVMLLKMLSNYDKKLRPNYLGKPVNVTVDATILSFTNLDAINMMYTVDMFFRQQWFDPRLKHNMNKTLTIIVGTKHPSDFIWTPDTVFENSVHSSMHHVTVNNHKLDIYSNGRVFWGTRVTVSPSCYLDLKSYPMDVQNCMFKIGSYAYDSSHLRYKWKKIPGIKIMDTEMAQFSLTNFETVEEEFHYVAGNFTVLMGKFRFKRQMGFAILQIYVPSIAIVSVSWISLWIRRNATPARVGLCITTLLTISTIWASVNATLPRVNYVKAIDIFLMTSFCCVILTLLEYTLVLNSATVMNMWRNKRPKRKKREESIMDLKGCYMEGQNSKKIFLGNTARRDIEVVEMLFNNQQKNLCKQKEDEEERQEEISKKEHEENEKLADKIEVFARVFFPFVYILFNVFYWSNYLLSDSNTEKPS